VLAGSDPAEGLELVEQPLHKVGLRIELRIVGTLSLAVGFCWHDHQRVPATPGIDEVMGVIPWVRPYRLGFPPVPPRQRLLAVRRLSPRQEKAQRMTQRVAYRLYWGREPAPRSA
jgi:hypothetical protein